MVDPTAPDPWASMGAADRRQVYTAAARIYTARLAHFLQTAPAVQPPKPETLDGSALPADVAAGLGFAAPAVWDPDLQAHKAIAEAFNLLETLDGLWPILTTPEEGGRQGLRAQLDATAQELLRGTCAHGVALRDPCLLCRQEMRDADGGGANG